MLKYLFLVHISILVISCEAVLANNSSTISSRWFVHQSDEKITNKQIVKKGFHLYIHRSYKNEHELKLIELAESIHRNKKENISTKNNLKIQKNTHSNDDPKWWFKTFDGVFLAYSITALSVHYYSDLLNDFAEERFKETNGIKILEASLTYKATVDFHDKWSYIPPDSWFKQFPGVWPDNVPAEGFFNVYVVKMKLEWDQYCGIKCGLLYKISRFVVFDKNMKLVSVIGDGNYDKIMR